ETGTFVEVRLEFGKMFQGTCDSAAAELQILPSSQALEYAAALGKEAKTASGPVVKGPALAVAEDLHVALEGMNLPSDGEQGRRLAGAVRPQQRDDLPGVDLEIDRVDRGRASVPCGETDSPDDGCPLSHVRLPGSGEVCVMSGRGPADR